MRALLRPPRSSRVFAMFLSICSSMLIVCWTPSASSAAQPLFESVGELATQLYRQMSNATQGRPLHRVAVLDFVDDQGATSQAGRCLAELLGEELSARSGGAWIAVPRSEIRRAFARGKAKKKGWRTAADVRPDQLAKLKLNAEAAVMGRVRVSGSQLDVSAQAYSIENGVNLGSSSVKIVEQELARAARSGSRCSRRSTGATAP